VEDGGEVPEAVEVTVGSAKEEKACREQNT
jgi:hypothetical protein